MFFAHSRRILLWQEKYTLTVGQRTSPVVVVMDGKAAYCSQVRSWFENSSYTTLEASNIFQAMGELADFTVADSPDVILLNVGSCDQELPLVIEMVESVSDEISVIAITQPAESSPRTYYAGNLSQVVNRLETIISSAALN